MKLVIWICRSMSVWVRPGIGRRVKYIMKIDRLIGILSILLQQEKVTAPYLAEKFEVSRRTINRDIEDICKAGIPLVTTQGQNGGISIMEGYRIDRTVLTSFEMQSILAGLRSLDSVSGTNRYQQMMDKLSAGSSSVLASNAHIVIDLSSWYRTSLPPKIELLQDAIERHELVAFDYYAPGGESRRVLEPYLLTFQWTSWYVWGYCRTREDYRLFKLNRMLELLGTGEEFEPREDRHFEMDVEKVFDNQFPIRVLFPVEYKWRLIEEFGEECFRQTEDGKRLLFEGKFADEESVISWVLQFGGKAELLEPECLRERIADVAKTIFETYRE